MSAGPVFVVGMNGSGTTMLADSLGNHPDLYMFRLEAKVLPYFLHHAERYGDLGQLAARRRLANDIGSAKPFWQVNGRKALVIPDSSLTEPGFAGVVNAIFAELAARDGKLRWGEKSPMNLGHIAVLGAEFPDAKFIHIIRDGREAAQSFHRRYGFEPRHTIYRWKKLVTVGREQGQALGSERYMEVQYEALTLEPELQMRRVCAYLGLAYTERVIESSMRMIDSAVAGERKAIVANSDKWHEYFDEATKRELERLAGRSLAAFGYAVAEPSGDAEVSAMRLRLWRARDWVARTFGFFRQRGWRGVPAFLRVVRAALLQGSVRKV